MSIIVNRNITEAPHKIWLILGFFLGLLLIVRFLGLYLSQTDLFFDEAQYWAWSQELDFGYFSKPPGIAWVIRTSTEFCGLSEFCVRLNSPILYSLSAFFIFLAGRVLYDAWVGLIAALAFVTLPGVSFSSKLISTDVPLLLFWAIALWSFVHFMKSQRLGWAILLGVAIGFGLLSKYAMLYFVGGCMLYGLISKSARANVFNMRFGLAIAIAAIIILPNILWNVNNGLVTFSHTADNANWSGSLGRPEKALEFFGAQFGVFGPILFAALLIIVWRVLSTGHNTKENVARSLALDERDKMLLCLSMPIIMIILVQAFLSRAHANWAATAYPAATLLVIATMIRDGAWRALSASFALHVLIIFMLIFAHAFAGRFALPGQTDPFWRVLGWSDIAAASEQILEQEDFNLILTDSRDMTAEMLYYLRDKTTPIYSWKGQPIPRDHFQLKYPYQPQNPPRNILLITFKENPKHILSKFNSVRMIEKRTIPAGQTKVRHIYFFHLIGYKPDAT